MLTTEQNPKYDVSSEGKIVVRSTGEAIPDDEPIFILRAREPMSTTAISAYALEVPSGSVGEIKERLVAFEAYRKKLTTRIEAK